MTDFKKAIELERKELDKIIPNGKLINILWSSLGAIEVECPHCGQRQLAHTVKSKKCIGCNSSFLVCPKNKPSRIIWCNPNKKYMLFQIQSLCLDNKFLVV